MRHIKANILHLEKKVLFEDMYSNKKCCIYGICGQGTRVIGRRRSKWDSTSTMNSSTFRMKDSMLMQSCMRKVVQKVV